MPSRWPMSWAPVWTGRRGCWTPWWASRSWRWRRLMGRVSLRLSAVCGLECVLNVLFSGGNSSVQQHRCGQSLPGQRQRQVPPSHDHLPVPDHLPALEQPGRRRQVGGLCSWPSIRRISAPPPLERWCEKHLQKVVSPLSLQGGPEPEPEDLWPSSRGGFPGHLQVRVVRVEGQWLVCVFFFYRYSNPDLRRRW